MMVIYMLPKCVARIVAAFAITGLSATASVAGVLNDTGLSVCLNSSNVAISCAGTGLDAETGRDVTNKNSKDGRLGFAFRKVCNSGDFAGLGTCPADPTLGAGANQWGCTQDRVTGLIWEVKATSGIRAYTNTYTNTMGPESGSALEFVNTVNSQGLCGAHDWRLPTARELQSLVDYGVASPKIDSSFFPNTLGTIYWTGSPMAENVNVSWVVYFNYGFVHFDGYRHDYHPVRLVR